MALSNLGRLAAGTLPSITGCSPSPTSRYSNPNSPETEVTFVIVGYLTSNANIMVFEVADAAFTRSSLTVGNSQTSNDINVVDSLGIDSQGLETYYSVDFGSNTSGEWTLNFNVTLKDGSTGSWVFTKKRVKDEIV